MELDPTTLDESSIYNFMMSTILPRPIAWVSTVDAEGRLNLAPYAYFMGVCCVPMTVLFCPVVPPPPKRKKDTLRNIEAVPEFVVNVASASPGGGWVVLGTVLAAHVDAALLDPVSHQVDLAGLRPIGRLGGGSFVNAASDTFTLTRYRTLADLATRK